MIAVVDLQYNPNDYSPTSSVTPNETLVEHQRLQCAVTRISPLGGLSFEQILLNVDERHDSQCSE